ncbi:CDK-activating kinase assembly factor MAT1 [Clonorchis sinensis]|uniref:CDK-activating kinase assembly factor MAT1 n=2 Tax=Clonorchis sinensis TaxID=79923 RepID=A0A419PYE4_CLOSI|nr:CDK-activating kinase assembly factor MAT1 [Clonorchis sinensis]
MLDLSQTCPSCRSSKYSNPQLKLMVNVCGHSLCENCVEVLFVRGSGLCVQCKTPIRKVNFRYQLFEDPLVQKEVELRKKILIDFNKREDDFDSLEQYDAYLEKIEEIIYNLMNDIDVEETKRYIELYKRENKDVIKRNRLRPSAVMQFYEAELEREAMLREQREREDEERRKELLKGSSNISTNTSVSKPKDVVSKVPPPSTLGRTFADPTSLAPPSIKRPPPSLARPVVPSSAQFPAPVSALATPRVGPDRIFIPPPPSAVGGGYMAPPSILPSSGSAFPALANSWIAGAHHQVQLPARTTSQARQSDTVLIPSRTTSGRSSTRGVGAKNLGAAVYKPYEPDLCGPPPPTLDHTRWPELLQVYRSCVIDSLQSRSQDRSSPTSSTHKIEQKSPEDSKPDMNGNGMKMEPMDSDEELKPKVEHTTPEPSSPLRGSSHDLPTGACGIKSMVFLERCLEESRCGLFL